METSITSLNPVLFSIVVCTYNRANILAHSFSTLLSSQKLINKHIEVILVDNCSKDSTKDIFMTVMSKNRNPFITYKYLFEPLQGLSYARNTGYLNAIGRYVLYLDDECTLPAHYLELAYQLVNKSKPAMLGGPFYGKFLPGFSSVWYKEAFGDCYLLQYDLPDGALRNQYLCGGNMLIRHDVFHKIGGFNTSFGMKGDDVDYGEEQEFQVRLHEKLPDEVVLYQKDLFVWHYIREEKVSLKWMFKDALIRGTYSAKVKEKNALLSILSPVTFIFNSLVALLMVVFLFLQSLVTQQHIYTLLFTEYESKRWRAIGGSWYRLRRLFNR